MKSIIFYAVFAMAFFYGLSHKYPPLMSIGVVGFIVTFAIAVGASDGKKNRTSNSGIGDIGRTKHGPM